MKSGSHVFKTVCLLLAAAAVFTAFAGCGPSGGENTTASGGNKPVVAVTIVPEGSFARAVCGNLAEVIVLVPPGFSPETYEPAPRDVEAFSRADIYFTVGVPVEASGYLTHTGSMKVVPLAEKVAQVYPDLTFAGGDRDSHIWLSPKRVKVMVETIAAEMEKLDPENKETYRLNAIAYLARLDALDDTIKQSLAGVKNRKFIVFHPAFGYFADDYGLEMVALEQDGKEATPGRLQQMIDFAKAEKIRVIFYQAEIDSSQSKAFAEEIGGKTAALEPLAENYIENLQSMAKLMAEEMA